MKVSRLTISNFRGIKDADLLLPDHVVLIGDNNVGKSTVFEALDLALGPDRLNRRPPMDEHDFYQGAYRAQGEDPPPEILIEATITHLNAEQRVRFKDYVEWWDENENKLHTSPPPNTIDQDHITHALRVAFSGVYDEEEDDFVGVTYFPKSDDEGEPAALSHEGQAILRLSVSQIAAHRSARPEPGTWQPSRHHPAPQGNS